ncbi:Zim17-type zinc finger protein [Actinidia rufa]|uniref:Zim17-type zinc finger protein n=1 Tax=Actinidia rufa TaxID=165716 RepID=A0A7J0DHP3_9ERIC|nr:Zim17-type zinc finger protein [Actinidia rufa]
MNYVKEEFECCLNKVTRPLKTTKGMKLPVWGLILTHLKVISNRTGNDNSAVQFNATSNLKVSSRHNLAMVFTCKVCETRSIKTMCRESYEKGVVVARCGGCNNLHLIADHLCWFVEDLAGCSSRRYGAPAPNRVGNGVRTRPHAPFEDRRVRSVSATCPGRSHALPRARGRTHAPARAKEEAARAATRLGDAPTCPHASARAEGVAHAPARAREWGSHTRTRHTRGRGKARATCALTRCHEGHIKRDCPKYKAQDQSSDTAATAVMAVDDDEIEVLLAASDDGNFDASGGILRVSKGNKEILWGKKTRGLYRLEGSVQTGELLSDMGPMVLARRMDKGSNRCTEVRKASAGVLGGSGVLCAQGRRDGATTTRKVTYFAAHPGGGCGAPRWGCRTPRLMGKLDQKIVRKDNLKTSDYPLVGWKGRLLSPAHLDESKPTWMSPSPVAKPKPDWSSYGVSM